MLRGQEPPPLKGPRESESDGSGGRVEDYLVRNGAFGLLKPALFAAAKHRPNDAPAYIATFIATAIAQLS